MANSFAINDAKVTSEGIQALVDGLTPMRVFSMAFGDVNASSIKVPIIASRSAVTYTNTYEVGDSTQTAATITLGNAPTICAWHQTEAEVNTAGANADMLFEMQSKEAFKGIGIAVQTAVFNLIVLATFGNTANTHKRVVASGALDADELLEIRKICVKTKKWSPDAQMSAVLDSGYMTGLLQDPAVRDRSASGADAAISGKVGRFSGIDLYENNLVAASTPGSGENLLGFLALPSAIAIAMKPVMPTENGYAAAQIVEDPGGSGVSVGYRRWVNTSTGTRWGAVSVDIGCVAAQTGALLRLVTA